MAAGPSPLHQSVHDFLVARRPLLRNVLRDRNVWSAVDAVAVGELLLLSAQNVVEDQAYLYVLYQSLVRANVRTGLPAAGPVEEQLRRAFVCDFWLNYMGLDQQVGTAKLTLALHACSVLAPRLDDATILTMVNALRGGATTHTMLDVWLLVLRFGGVASRLFRYAVHLFHAEPRVKPMEWLLLGADRDAAEGHLMNKEVDLIVVRDGKPGQGSLGHLFTLSMRMVPGNTLTHVRVGFDVEAGAYYIPEETDAVERARRYRDLSALVTYLGVQNTVGLTVRDYPTQVAQAQRVWRTLPGMDDPPPYVESVVDQLPAVVAALQAVERTAQQTRPNDLDTQRRISTLLEQVRALAV